jgi:hypothetical protein
MPGQGHNLHARRRTPLDADQFLHLPGRPAPGRIEKDITDDMIINVVNKYHSAKGEWIGRPSPLGNPFTKEKGYSREEAVKKYSAWLKSMICQKNKIVLQELARLKKLAKHQGELNLVCVCAPKLCHGDIIKRCLMWLLEKEFFR